MSRESLVQGAAISRDVAASVAEARQELKSMPFFVRPMVKRGFRKRTGRTMEEWVALCRDISTRFEAGEAEKVIAKRLIPDLERLKESFRSAPERAERGMGGDADAMARVRERSANRAHLVDELIHAIAALEQEPA